MDEKIIIEGQYNYINKLKKVMISLIIITIIFSALTIIFSSIMSSYGDKADAAHTAYDPFGRIYDSSYKEGRDPIRDAARQNFLYYNDICFDYYNWYWLFHILSITSTILLVLTALFYFAIKNTQLVITNKRAYGCTLWGKRVDLPLDSISAVATTASLFKGICIATSSGKILFYSISNRDEIHKEVSALLIERQKTNNTSNVIPPQTTSNNMDDIIKLKEMLDMGILSQEEFDAKKKQLLGL